MFEYCTTLLSDLGVRMPGPQLEELDVFVLASEEFPLRFPQLFFCAESLGEFKHGTFLRHQGFSGFSLF